MRGITICRRAVATKMAQNWSLYSASKLELMIVKFKNTKYQTTIRILWKSFANDTIPNCPVCNVIFISCICKFCIVCIFCRIFCICNAYYMHMQNIHIHLPLLHLHLLHVLYSTVGVMKLYQNQPRICWPSHKFLLSKLAENCYSPYWCTLHASISAITIYCLFWKKTTRDAQSSYQLKKGDSQMSLFVPVVDSGPIFASKNSAQIVEIFTCANSWIQKLCALSSPPSAWCWPAQLRSD